MRLWAQLMLAVPLLQKSVYLKMKGKKSPLLMLCLLAFLKQSPFIIFQHIHITHTRLAYLRPSVFIQLPLLKSIDLRWNQLNHYDGSLILPQKFQELYLSGKNLEHNIFSNALYMFTNCYPQVYPIQQYFMCTLPISVVIP